MASQKMAFRYIKKADMEAVVRVEGERLTYKEDFGLTGGVAEHNGEKLDLTPVEPDLVFDFVRRWAKNYQDIEGIIGQRKSKEDGIYETRTQVGELEPGHPVAAFSYEMQPDAFEIVFFTFDPNLDMSARREVMRFMEGKADHHPTRKKVVAHVIDGDWEVVKAFQAAGWSSKLVSDYFELPAISKDDPPKTVDAFRFTYESKSESDDEGEGDPLGV